MQWPNPRGGVGGGVSAPDGVFRGRRIWVEKKKIYPIGHFSVPLAISAGSEFGGIEDKIKDRR